MEKDGRCTKMLKPIKSKDPFYNFFRGMTLFAVVVSGIMLVINLYLQKDLTLNIITFIIANITFIIMPYLTGNVKELKE
jgi:hypothetical protein